MHGHFAGLALAFHHQQFIAGMVGKIRQVREMIERVKPGIELEVDGGIDPVTAPVAAKAGANVFVAGSAIFGHDRPWEAAESIRTAIGQTAHTWT